MIVPDALACDLRSCVVDACVIAGLLASVPPDELLASLEELLKSAEQLHRDSLRCIVRLDDLAENAVELN
jgi:hypothetical protein